MDKQRLEKIKQYLQEEYDKAIQDKEYSIARQIDFAIEGLTREHNSEFYDKYNYMELDIRNPEDLGW